METATRSCFCVGCNEVFVIPMRRGRAPKFCKRCRPEESKPTGAVKTLIPQPQTAPRAPVAPVSSKMMMVQCHGCDEVFGIPSRRGKPPKYCGRCLSDGVMLTDDKNQREADRARANLRIDNLEMMLRSRGTHISQAKGW